MRPIAAWLCALLVALAAQRSVLAETVSIELPPLVGSYGPGRTVHFDLGVRFVSVRFATLTWTGLGRPGVYERCRFSSGIRECTQFHAFPGALFIIDAEGPGFWPYYGSLPLGEQVATRSLLLIGDEADRAVFLDGEGDLVITHDGFVSIPEDPIYEVVPQEFELWDFALSVEGVRWRGVDFEDVAVPPGELGPPVDAVASGDFAFTSPGGRLRLANGIVSADSGNTYLAQSPLAGSEEIRMARGDGASFSLVAFDAAEWDGIVGTEILVQGSRADGTQVERRFALDGVFDGSGPRDDFESLRLDGAWSGLQQVRFVGLPVELEGGLFALDDLVAPPTEDLDGDGVDDAFDLCPGAADPDQADTDGNGVGDACNDFEDPDGDDRAGAFDNCPWAANPDQANRDSDLWGDACDLCPDSPLGVNVDRDRNGIGDPCECGDQTQDGTVDVRDLVAIRLAILGQVPVSPLCDTNADDRCDVSDIVGANLKIFGAPAWCSRYPPPP